MADKSINQLNPASTITASDLFVLQQNNEAKSLPGQVLINWLTAAADGHGGISGISKTGTSGLVDTYTITLADTTSYTFTVTNGAKGDKGDTGQAWYLHIKYASVYPDSDEDMHDDVDDWIGIYSGTSSTAPTNFAAYTWFNMKGEKGDTGDTGVSITTYSIAYQASISGTVVPVGTWTQSIPSVAQGQYLWTRTIASFSDGRADAVSYSVARMGLDGAGSVSQVNNVSPDANGNVEINGDNVPITNTDDRSIYDVIYGIYDRFEGMNYPVDFTNLTFTETAGVYSAQIDDEYITDDMQPAHLYLANRGAKPGSLTITASDGHLLFTMPTAPTEAFTGYVMLHSVGDGSSSEHPRPESADTATVEETLAFLGIETE